MRARLSVVDSFLFSNSAPQIWRLVARGALRISHSKEVCLQSFLFLARVHAAPLRPVEVPPVLHTERRSLARLRVLGGRTRVGQEHRATTVEAALRHAQGQALVTRDSDPNSHKFTKLRLPKLS